MGEVRARLDALDDRIVALLAERYAVLGEVVELKRVHKLSHRIPARVEVVLARNEARGVALGLPDGYVRRLYTLIIEESHRFERDKLGY